MERVLGRSGIEVSAVGMGCWAIGGRTLAQGALAWIWGRSPRTVPILGFKNAVQVEENAGAMGFGPLTPKQIGDVEGILHLE